MGYRQNIVMITVLLTIMALIAVASQARSWIKVARRSETGARRVARCLATVVRQENLKASLAALSSESKAPAESISERMAAQVDLLRRIQELRCWALNDRMLARS